jgi:hypothetical protein
MTTLTVLAALAAVVLGVILALGLACLLAVRFLAPDAESARRLRPSLLDGTE